MSRGPRALLPRKTGGDNTIRRRSERRAGTTLYDQLVGRGVGGGCEYSSGRMPVVWTYAVKDKIAVQLIKFI